VNSINRPNRKIYRKIRSHYFQKCQFSMWYTCVFQCRCFYDIHQSAALASCASCTYSGLPTVVRL